jgi:hypothetical protein
MRRIARVCFLAGFFLVEIFPAYSQSSTPFFPVDELRAGMKGIGKTVFEGTTIEDFDVEILGVLKNSAPKQDMIMARVSGGPLARTGVMQGMSGSPVYIDGRLVGALAFAFNFSKDPIGGIQPIGQMVDILDEYSTDAAGDAGLFPLEGPRAYVNKLMVGLTEGDGIDKYLFPQSWMSRNPVVASLAGGGMTQIRTPLSISGVSPVAIRHFAGLFEAFGFSPVQGGGSGSAASIAAAAGTGIEPGDSINAELVRGDISVSANGTVTHVDGDKIYAFGHPFMSTGPTDVPMSKGHVITLIPSVSASFKVAVPLQVVGSFKQDRATGIYGKLGELARMIPVTVDVRTSRDGTERYEFEVVNDRFLTPFMMNFTVFNAILASERGLGESTLQIRGKIHLVGGEQVEIDNAFAGDMNGPARATIATVAPITYLLSGGFEGLVIDSVELEIDSIDRKRSALLDALTVDRTEVRAGDTVALAAHLRTAGGDEIVEKYSVRIPIGLAPGRVQLLVGDGVTVTTSELQRAPSGVPRDLQQILRELNKLRKTDRLYVKVLSEVPGVVVGGEELPSLPPSMLALMQTGRSSDSNTSGTRSSAVGEFELPASDYVIQGQRSLSLTIIP